MDWISALIQLVSKIVGSIKEGIVSTTKERMQTLRTIFTDTNDTIENVHHKEKNGVGFYIVMGILILGLVFVIAYKQKK